MRRLLGCVLFGVVAGAGLLAQTQPPSNFSPTTPAADLVLRGGDIVTLDPQQPRVEAVAVRNGRIEAIGRDQEIASTIGPHTRVLDLHGAFVTPGFIEGHGHLLSTGEALLELNLGQAPNWTAIVALVQKAVARARPGEWIVGTGWQQSKWDRKPEPNVGGLPLPNALDAVSPRNPVLLEHASGHAIYVNAVALRRAGITRNTPDPPGGSIVRGPDGSPIGMLRDAAGGAVYRAYNHDLAALPAAEREARRQKALHLAVQNEIEKGITGFVDMGEDFATTEWLRQQAAKGVPLRLYVNIRGESPQQLAGHLARYRVIGADDDHFTVRGVGEIIADGALGTRSAWFLKPYTDAPGLSGSNVTSMATIRRIAEICARNGWQLSVHAIGGRANREVLNVYAAIFAQDPVAHTRGSRRLHCGQSRREKAAKFRRAARPRKAMRRDPDRLGLSGVPGRSSVSGSLGVAERGPAPINALRWRIEHAQHLNPADIPRFAALGVMASMQSIHACSDAPFVVARIGEQRAREGAYVWHSLLETGALVLDGTDTPVEDTNPIPNFYCAVTRRESNGRYFFPDQVKTRMQELRSYTWDNAYAVFEDTELGSITPGKRADLDVFSGNLLTMPASDILRTRVLDTIVGGKIVYQRPGAASWRKGERFSPMPEFDHVN